MSGIYIPGVTVPEDNTILLRIFPESDGIYYTEQLDIDEDILDKYFAIPVPDHGDLIDRGYAIATACSGRIRTLPTTEDGEDWIRVEEVRESIKAAPTIIPADKEGE